MVNSASTLLRRFFGECAGGYCSQEVSDMFTSTGLDPGSTISGEKGQALAELLLILAPLSAVLALAVCTLVLASST